MIFVKKHDGAGVQFFDRPGRRKAAGRHFYLRQEMSNASGNDQDEEDCDDDPKRAHFAVSAPNALRLPASRPAPSDF